MIKNCLQNCFKSGFNIAVRKVPCVAGSNLLSSNICHMPPVPTVCSEENLLGVHIDSKLSFEHHVSKLCQRASNKLYALARTSPYMDHNKLRILMRAFITNQFQYCPLRPISSQRNFPSGRNFRQ